MAEGELGEGVLLFLFQSITELHKSKRDSVNVQVILILMAFLHSIIFDVLFKSI